MPAGIGVLPLVDFPRPAQSGVPYELRYLGARGDTVVLEEQQHIRSLAARSIA